MLKIDNYSNYILKDITFELKQDRDIVLLGSNGAGKTTLAKLLCGITTSENVTIDNKHISTLFSENRTKLINYIPAKFEIFDEYISAYEYLQMNKLHSNITIDEVMKLLDIGYLKDTSCKNISSGESQLLLVASAILHNAQITIFDEITSNLDPQRFKEIFQILKDIKWLNNKIVITHNLSLAYKLGYDVVFIKDGQIIFNGTSEDFFSDTNLDIFFNNSVKKIEDHIVVDL